jgi:hypothetical protein
MGPAQHKTFLGSVRDGLPRGDPKADRVPGDPKPRTEQFHQLPVEARELGTKVVQ